MTISIQFPIQHLESELQNVEESERYVDIDMAHAYWQLRLAQDSQEMLNIQTPFGVFSPTRTFQGGTDSENHYQAVTNEKFLEAGSTKFLQWVNDFLSYNKSEQGLLRDIELFFKFWDEFGFKIHAKKSNLFPRSVRFGEGDYNTRWDST